jgi:hypothetical protein
MTENIRRNTVLLTTLVEHRLLVTLLRAKSQKDSTNRGFCF